MVRRKQGRDNRGFLDETEDNMNCLKDDAHRRQGEQDGSRAHAAGRRSRSSCSPMLEGADVQASGTRAAARRLSGQHGTGRPALLPPRGCWGHPARRPRVARAEDWRPPYARRAVRGLASQPRARRACETGRPAIRS